MAGVRCLIVFILKGEIKMPRSTRKVASTGRIYYQQKGDKEAVRKDAERKKARRVAAKKWGEAAIKGKDVDHIVPLSKGGKTIPSNLRLVSPTTNRKKNKRPKK